MNVRLVLHLRIEMVHFVHGNKTTVAALELWLLVQVAKWRSGEKTFSWLLNLREFTNENCESTLSF